MTAITLEIPDELMVKLKSLLRMNGETVEEAALDLLTISVDDWIRPKGADEGDEPAAPDTALTLAIARFIVAQPPPPRAVAEWHAVRDALAGAGRNDTEHLLATEANAQRMMEAVGQARPATLDEAIAQLPPEARSDMETMRHIRQEHRPLLDALAAQPGDPSPLGSTFESFMHEYGIEAVGLADALAAQPVGLFASLTLEQQAQAVAMERDGTEEPNAAHLEPPHAAGPDVAGIAAAVRRQALLDALAAVERVAARDSETAAAVRDLFYRDDAAPVDPPHAAAPALAPLAPEPHAAVLGRAGEALAWDGQQPPVLVPFEPGVRHPYGDAAFHVAAHVTPDGKARLFPSKAAANVWLCANGTVPV